MVQSQRSLTIGWMINGGRPIYGHIGMIGMKNHLYIRLYDALSSKILKNLEN